MRRTLITLAIALISIGLAGSLVVADGALHIYDRSEPDEPQGRSIAAAANADCEPAQVTSSDGTVLRAWIFTPHAANAAAVILLHGVGASRSGVLEHVNYLLAAGFTVLTPDARGHGVSGGDFITYGIKEAADVHAWANWLFDRRPISRLYGMGESMGAAVILQSLATERRWRAVVAQCPFATFDEVAFDRLSGRTGWPRAPLWPVIQIGYLYARLNYGVDLHRASPIEAVRATTVPVLLIHGTADRNIPFRHSLELHAANPRATVLWLIPGAGHMNSMTRNPQLYAERVTTWFRDH